MLIGGVKSGHLSVETLCLVGPENRAWEPMEQSPDQSSGCFPASLAHTQHSTTHSSFSTRLHCLSPTRGHHSMWHLFSFTLCWICTTVLYLDKSEALSSLCLDGIAFIAIRANNMIMVSPYNRRLQGFLWEAQCLHGCYYGFVSAFLAWHVYECEGFL